MIEQESKLWLAFANLDDETTARRKEMRAQRRRAICKHTFPSINSYEESVNILRDAAIKSTKAHIEALECSLKLQSDNTHPTHLISQLKHSKNFLNIISDEKNSNEELEEVLS